MSKKTKEVNLLDALLAEEVVGRLPEGDYTATITLITPALNDKDELELAITLSINDGKYVDIISNITKEGKTYNFLDEFFRDAATLVGNGSKSSIIQNLLNKEIPVQLQHNGRFDRFRYFEQPTTAPAPTTTATTPAPTRRKRA